MTFHVSSQYPSNGKNIAIVILPDAAGHSAVRQSVLKFNLRISSNVSMQYMSKSAQTSGIFRFARSLLGFEFSVVTTQ